jgi:DNA modification methylase
MSAAPNSHNVRLKLDYWPIERLRPNLQSARTHSRQQKRMVKASIREFGNLLPFLVSGDTLISGHLRLEVCKELGHLDAPVVAVEHLTPAQLKAFQIAENRLAEMGGWDERILGETLRDLTLELPDLNLDVTGFVMPEIDLFIEGLQEKPETEDPDDAPVVKGVPVSRSGDLWTIGRHRILCGDALKPDSYARLMEGSTADAVITDPPYNVAARSIGGRGRIKHANFAMAAGEMSDAEFTAFLTSSCGLMSDLMKDGAIAFIFMDWRHLQHLLAAGGQAFDELKNICVWNKTQAGQGAFYRSQHELVAVFKKGRRSHRNNVQLGRYGRSRSNVWTCASPAAFGRESEEGRLLEGHPSPKPVALIMDAILDVTARGDVVLDPFLGGGATLLAAERSGRACYGMELDPGYVDYCLRRLRRHCGIDPVREADGKTFGDLEEASV